MSPIVPPLAAVFAAIPDYRHARSKRRPLVVLLLLASVAMLAGVRGLSGIADWATNYGEPWRTRLGATDRTRGGDEEINVISVAAARRIHANYSTRFRPLCSTA